MTTEFMDGMYAVDPRLPAWLESLDKASSDPIIKGVRRVRPAGHPDAVLARDGLVLQRPRPRRGQDRRARVTPRRP